MKPVDQEFLSDPENGVIGDCVRACVASILSLPIAEVPHFVAERSATWAAYLDEWLWDLGYEIRILGHEENPDYPILVVGGSPRSPHISHMVIMNKGVVVHDPHPSRAGIVGNWIRRYAIVKLV